MKTTDIFIVHPKTTEQANALKAFMQALKIKFEIMSDSTYNPDFVAKIKKSQQQFEGGDFTSVEKDNLQKFLGL